MTALDLIYHTSYKVVCKVYSVHSLSTSAHSVIPSSYQALGLFYLSYTCSLWLDSSMRPWSLNKWAPKINYIFIRWRRIGHSGSRDKTVVIWKSFLQCQLLFFYHETELCMFCVMRQASQIIVSPSHLEEFKSVVYVLDWASFFR